MIKDCVSVIVPIYNMYHYLEKCLNSILEQTYQNLQVICIDDGSTDRTWELLKEYSKKDNRIEIIHQDNKGVSNARNRGLLQVKGSFFSFIDPDDYISKTMYESLVSLVTRYDADIGCGAMLIENEKGIKELTNEKDVPTERIDGISFLKYMLKREEYRAVGGNCHTKIFRTESFIDEDGKIGISFAEDLMYGEGVLFTTTAMIRARAVVYRNMPLYHYYQRGMSSTHDKEKTLKNMGNVIAYDRAIALMKEERVPLHIQIWAKRFLVYHAILCGRLAIELNQHGNDRMICENMDRYSFAYCITNLLHPSRIWELRRLRKTLGK